MLTPERAVRKSITMPRLLSRGEQQLGPESRDSSVGDDKIEHESSRNTNSRPIPIKGKGGIESEERCQFNGFNQSS